MYKFINHFFTRYKERFEEFPMTDDLRNFILNFCNETKPFSIVDNKHRKSDYFTFVLHDDELITIICDGKSKEIKTCIREAHKREKFYENRYS